MRFITKQNFVAFIFVAAIVLIVSCKDKIEPKPETQMKNGLIYNKDGVRLFTGQIKDTINGKAVEYEVVNGEKNGLFKIYYPNGQPEMVGEVKDNLNNGNWTYYYENGQVESVGKFVNDLPEGRWIWFYENGNIKEEGNYVKGNRAGEWILYDVDGNIKEKRMLDRDSLREKKK